MTTLAEVRARFARNQGLPFADSLTELSILDALNEHGVQYRDRLFNPVITIWGFLSQVLSDDHSCRDAVARVIAHQAASGAEVCSPNTASYCNARSRLRTDVLRRRARRGWEKSVGGCGGRGRGQRWFSVLRAASAAPTPATAQNARGSPRRGARRPRFVSRVASSALLLSIGGAIFLPPVTL